MTKWTGGVAASTCDSYSEGPSIESCSHWLGHGCYTRSGAQRHFVVLSERANRHFMKEEIKNGLDTQSVNEWILRNFVHYTQRVQRTHNREVKSVCLSYHLPNNLISYYDLALTVHTNTRQITPPMGVLFQNQAVANWLITRYYCSRKKIHYRAHKSRYWIKQIHCCPSFTICLRYIVILYAYLWEVVIP